jgi:hypothetical protein
MSSAPRRLGLLAAVLLVAWLALLQVRAMDREAALVVVWTAGLSDAPVRHVGSGRWGWAGRADAEALVVRVTEARGWRATERLAADAAAPGVRVASVRGRRVVLAEVPAGGLPEARERVAAAGERDLLVVATNAPPEAVQAAFEGPLAVLPGAFAAGVPDGGEAVAADRLVAPWVDGRRRVGVLDVRFQEAGITLRGTAVDIPLGEAPADAPTRIGRAPPGLDHDLIHLRDSGLGKALLASMLARTGADLAIVNHLALRAGLSGDIDLVALESALPFRNEIVLQTFDTPTLEAILARGGAEDTRRLLVATPGAFGASALPTPLPARDWRVATVDYLANGGRGGWEAFTAGRDRMRTRITLDDLAIDLLEAP